MNDQRNLFLAIAISLALLLGVQYMRKPAVPTPEQAIVPVTEQAVVVPVEGPHRDRAVILAEESAQRVRIETDKIHGSIGAVGGRFDDLTLPAYRVTVDKNSPEVSLLSPAGTDSVYFTEFGWTAKDTALALPDAKTVWQISGGPLTTKNPVTLTWDNGHGLLFERVVSIDENYMFSVTQTVRNTTDKPVSMAAYGQIVRHSDSPSMSHSGHRTVTPTEGIVGYFNEKLSEETYSSLIKESEKYENKRAFTDYDTTGGWIGLSDMYWLVALIPSQTDALHYRMGHVGEKATGRFIADAALPEKTVAPGQAISDSFHLYAGAKELPLLEAYGQALGLSLFDRSIDFGWFYFLAKPFFHAMVFLGHWAGNMGIGILILSMCVRFMLFPLANNSFRSMAKMKVLSPELAKIQALYRTDKVRMNQEVMALYKRERVNPLGGCFPLLLQLPVFWALFKVLSVAIEIRHAPFYGWVQDLSAPDTTTLFNLFGLIPWTPPDALMIGILPILMGITMYLQQRLNPPPSDPVQARMLMAMPFIITYMMAAMPAGLVIYWIWGNILSILQHWIIARRVEKELAARKGAVEPATGA